MAYVKNTGMYSFNLLRMVNETPNITPCNEQQCGHPLPVTYYIQLNWFYDMVSAVENDYWN